MLPRVHSAYKTQSEQYVKAEGKSTNANIGPVKNYDNSIIEDFRDLYSSHYCVAWKAVTADTDFCTGDNIHDNMSTTGSEIQSPVLPTLTPKSTNAGSPQYEGYLHHLHLRSIYVVDNIRPTSHGRRQLNFSCALETHSLTGFRTIITASHIHPQFLLLSPYLPFLSHSVSWSTQCSTFGFPTPTIMHNCGHTLPAATMTPPALPSLLHHTSM